MVYDRGTIVKNKNTGKDGVVIPDDFRCCSPNQECVVYDGTDVFLGTDKEVLEVVGEYDESVTNPFDCGLGLGSFCCKYLTMVGPNDFKCARFSPFRNQIIFREMRAKGEPLGLKPKCQDEIKQAHTDTK